MMQRNRGAPHEGVDLCIGGLSGASAPISRIRRTMARMVWTSPSVDRKFYRITASCAGSAEVSVTVPRLSGCSMMPLMPNASV